MTNIVRCAVWNYFIDNSIRTKEAGGFMAQFTELSKEDITEANKMILEFLEQTV